MRHALKRLWQQHRLAVIGFVLASAATVFFAVRFLVFTVYWSDPTHQNQPLEPWMTVSYVVHSWQVPSEQVLKALGLRQMPPHRTSLAELATEMGISKEILLDRLSAVLTNLSGQPAK